MNFSSDQDHSVLKSYGNFQHQEFTRKKKSFILFSFAYWGGLMIQNSFQIARKHSYNQTIVFEILLYFFYVSTWFTYCFLVHKASKSYRWYKRYEIFAALFAAVSGPIHVFLALSNYTVDETFRYQIESSFSILPFFYITQRAGNRTISFGGYVTASTILIILVSKDYSAAAILRSILFCIALTSSFIILNVKSDKGTRATFTELVSIREKDQVWKFLLENLPDGMAMVSTDHKITYQNPAFKELVCMVVGPSAESQEKLFFQNLELRKRDQLDLDSAAALRSFLMGSEQILSLEEFLSFDELPMLEFHSDIHLPASLKYAIADGKIGSSEIEVRAAKTKIDSKICYIILIADVTQRDLLSRLEDSNGFKDSLLKSISHELRGPLNGSMLSVEQVLQTNLDITQKESLQLSLNCQKRLLKTINGIIDLGKMNSNTFELQIDRVDLKSVLDENLEIYRKPIVEKGLEIKVYVDESTLVINSDRQRIDQVFFHFLDNALKFTESGSITLNLMKNQDQNGSVIFSVEDTGIGMKAEEVSKIKRLYNTSQLNPKTSKNSAGMGYGLTLTANILKQIAENFEINSEEGVGSKFCCKFKNFFAENQEGFIQLSCIQQVDSNPRLFSKDMESFDMNLQTPNKLLSLQVSMHSCDVETLQELDANEIKLFPSKQQNLSMINMGNKSPANSPTTTLPFISLPKQSRKNTVLIVDDDMFNVFALTSVLKSLGHEVLSAYNGRDGVKIVKESHQQIFVIFMDLNMPVMDGHEATSILKTLMTRRQVSLIPIIAATAYAQEVEMKKAMTNGFDGFLTKPLEASKVKELIDKYKNN